MSLFGAVSGGEVLKSTHDAKKETHREPTVQACWCHPTGAVCVELPSHPFCPSSLLATLGITTTSTKEKGCRGIESSAPGYTTG